MAKTNNIPKDLILVKEYKCSTGKVQILKNVKTREHEWRTVSRNGKIIGYGKGLNSVQSCHKGMNATVRIIAHCQGLDIKK
jgi:uncharacterized protein YegP (UPF0339 family)